MLAAIAQFFYSVLGLPQKKVNKTFRAKSFVKVTPAEQLCGKRTPWPELSQAWCQEKN